MRVAVAVITDTKRRILITQRPIGTSHAGFWEFPGGKLEVDESAISALCREVKEEVGLDVVAYEYLGEVSHTYPSYEVTLLIYHVHGYEGVATCLEAQMGMRWVDFKSLSQYTFPEANLDVIKLIRPLFE